MSASADGKVALADATRVYRLDLATGKATPVVGRGTANLAGSTPDTSVLNITGLAVAPDGDLLISDDEARQVKRVPAAAW
jgi:glucose/arabinose dehydrogenase